MVYREYSYAALLVHLCYPFGARVLPLLLALLFESLYRWLCRKVWDHFFCLQVDELTRKWVDKLMRKWVWRGSMSQYFYGFG